MKSSDSPMKGSVLVSLRQQRPINEFELGRMCGSFGDVKSIRPCRVPEYEAISLLDAWTLDDFPQPKDRPIF